MRSQILKIPLLLNSFILYSAISFGQSDTTTVRKAIELRQYIFKAQTMSPLKGGSRQLTTEYSLKVSKDTIVAYLPYVGRAFTAPINTTDGGINFTSIEFTYQAGLQKKKKWEITINPKDASDVRELNLTVFTNGRASLRVTSNNREPISFDGYVYGK